MGHWGLSMGIWEGSVGYRGCLKLWGGSMGRWGTGSVGHWRLSTGHWTLGSQSEWHWGLCVWPRGESKGQEGGSMASWDMSWGSAGALGALGWLDCHRRHWGWDIRADKQGTFIFLGVPGQGQPGSGHGHVGLNGIWD